MTLQLEQSAPLKYYSLRITPDYIEEPQEIISYVKLITKGSAQDLIIVEEEASHKHYHILFRTHIHVNTLRNRIKNKTGDVLSKDFYCLKKQISTDDELRKAWRYLYKGKSKSELPIIIESHHSIPISTEYHEQYWEIHQQLLETDSNSTVEKAWLYYKATFPIQQRKKNTFGHIAAHLQYNRIKTQRPPYPNYTLQTYIEYILVKQKEDQGEELQQILMDRYIDKEIQISYEDKNF
jgi:hypothetical protein